MSDDKQLWLHKDAFIQLATATSDPDIRGDLIFWGTKQELIDLAAEIKNWIAFDIDQVTDRLRKDLKKVVATL